MNGSPDSARPIERAEELARAHPEAADLLRLYAAILAGADCRTTARRIAPGATDEEVEALCRRVSARAFPCSGPHTALLAVLRPEGDGGKRSLLCAVCGTEWEFRRMVCPNCGEENRDNLPVFTAEQFPHIRIEACDSCRTYLKAIDLTKNGLAVPEADEIAALALDLWAQNQGYTKIAPNLLGV